MVWDLEINHLNICDLQINGFHIIFGLSNFRGVFDSTFVIIIAVSDAARNKTIKI